VAADLRGTMGDAIPRLIERLDDSNENMCRAVAKVMAELAKNSM
jgi:hypothetical protein